MPRQRNNLGVLRQSQSDYISNFDAIIKQLSAMKRVEPPGCEIIRRFITSTMNSFNERFNKEQQKMVNSIIRSQLSSDDQSTTLSDVQVAYNSSTKLITDLSIQYLNDVNTRCAQLNPSKVIDECSAKLACKPEQLDAANKLVAMPQQFDREIQLRWATVEKVFRS